MYNRCPWLLIEPTGAECLQFADLLFEGALWTESLRYFALARQAGEHPDPGREALAHLRAGQRTQGCRLLAEVAAPRSPSLDWWAARCPKP